MKSNYKYTKFYRKNVLYPSRTEEFTRGLLTSVDRKSGLGFGTIKQHCIVNREFLLGLISDLDVITKESCFQ